MQEWANPKSALHEPGYLQRLKRLNGDETNDEKKRRAGTDRKLHQKRARVIRAHGEDQETCEGDSDSISQDDDDDAGTDDPADDSEVDAKKKEEHPRPENETQEGRGAEEATVIREEE